MANTNMKKVRTSDLELKDRLVSIQRVTKVTKGGRTDRKSTRLNSSHNA